MPVCIGCRENKQRLDHHGLCEWCAPKLQLAIRIADTREGYKQYCGNSYIDGLHRAYCFVQDRINELIDSGPEGVEEIFLSAFYYREDEGKEEELNKNKWNWACALAKCETREDMYKFMKTMEDAGAEVFADYLIQTQIYLEKIISFETVNKRLRSFVPDGED